MEYTNQLIVFCISLASNILSALSGGGAGLIQLPALLFLGLPFGVALATHKIASVALGLGAAAKYIKNTPLNIRFITVLLVSGVPGVIFGATMILSFSDQLAKSLLGILIMGLGLYSFFNPKLGQTCISVHRDLFGCLVGAGGLFLIGILNGSLTAGTGLFVTLWMVWWFGFDFKLATAYTLVTVGIFWNGSGAIVLGFLSEIYWSWLPVLILGSFLGGFIGAHLAIVKGNHLIKRVFEGLTILIGFKLILG